MNFASLLAARYHANSPIAPNGLLLVSVWLRRARGRVSFNKTQANSVLSPRLALTREPFSRISTSTLRSRSSTVSAQMNMVPPRSGRESPRVVSSAAPRGASGPRLWLGSCLWSLYPTPGKPPHPSRPQSRDEGHFLDEIPLAAPVCV